MGFLNGSALREEGHTRPGVSSARRSQIFATLQSRLTVEGERSRTSAVSSVSSPPKYRSSTIRHCRGSIFSSSVSAS